MLIDQGHTPVILDNFSTGRREFVADRIAYEGDFTDVAVLDTILAEHPDIDAVVHCAAAIVVPESVSDPVYYYRNNVAKTLEFAEYLQSHGITRLLFSSSASIYAVMDDFAVDESCPLAPTSPYARTKAVVEGMLEDIANATPLTVLSLRYFNPIGTDPQLRTGLQLKSPSHALGKLIEAKDAQSTFTITGTDYPTRDGSGIRDYVHVWDLAAAHLAALERFDAVLGEDSYRVINLGTGQGTTVFELVAAFESVTGEPLDSTTGPARPGDQAGAFTRSSLAADLLDWTPQHSIEEGIADTLKWFAVRGEILPDLA